MEVLLLFFQQANERAVDIAKAEEAEIKRADAISSRGLRPWSDL
jgi:hypothetical protein